MRPNNSVPALRLPGIGSNWGVVRAIPRGIEERTVASYIIDKSHSEALFQVRHLVTKLGGRFNDFEGTLAFEEGNPGASSVSMTLQAASIDTNNQDRDNHLRSVDFFDVEKFPLITFQSTSVTGGGSDYNVVGNLTLHGVTKEVMLPAAFRGNAKDHFGNARIGFESVFSINRKDFGLGWNVPLDAGGFVIGDVVEFTLSVQALAQ